MDEELSPRLMFFSPWSFLFILFLIIIGNLFVIDVILFSIKDSRVVLKQSSATPVIQPIKSTVIDTCGANCKEEIEKQIAQSSINSPSVKTQTTISAPSVKEYFIPLGSGSSAASDWEDVPGAQAYIDSTAYGKIKTVTFEASLYTPTDNQIAYARLFNITDKHPVWNSDVSIEGGTPQLKISSPINFDSGSKLYGVQMKTQLQSRTNLESARIHITTY